METGPSSSAEVVSSASSSCLRSPLGCLLLLSTCGLPLVSVSYGFSRPSGRCCFSLFFFRPSCPSVSILYRSGAVFFWASCPLGEPWFPVLWSPCGVSRFAALSLVLSGRRDSCILVRWVLSTLRWCSTVSLLFVGLLLVRVQPVLFLFSVSSVISWGAALRAFLLFGFWSPLGSPFRSVAVSSELLFSTGSEFLPSLHGWSVGFSRGSAALASLRGQGGSSRVVLVLCLRVVSVRLPSFLSCSFGVFAAWWLPFPLGKLLHDVCLGLLLRHLFFVEGFREWHFDAQWSPGLANSL